MNWSRFSRRAASESFAAFEICVDNGYKNTEGQAEATSNDQSFAKSFTAGVVKLVQEDE
jgi:hypothetical protein